uniref:MSHA biogenesis protein MshI n=1 Tax=Rheinheimera sp. BAL341 TaxID=1708203 RepID=A0A486XJA6_9GAMM
MLRKILQQFGASSQLSESIAVIYMAQDGLTFLLWQQNKVKQQQIYKSDGGQWQHSLRAALKAISAGSRIHFVLSAAYYQLVQLDKPALADDELLQALPWQVKDLVTIAPEDMVLDYIDLPGSNLQQVKINVVVASCSWLQQLVAIVDLAGLAIETIRPDEWLLPRLLAAAEQATMLVVHQPEQEVLIQIVRNGQLYFSRRTRGFSRLHLTTENNLAEGTLDRLLLELQRSMDYFESQLKQPPVRDIRLLMAETELMCDLFRQNGFNRTEPLLLPANVIGAENADFVSNWPLIAAVQQQLPVSELKQHVNLYQAKLYPVRERLSLKRLAWALASVTAFVTVSWLLLAQQHSVVAKQLADTELKLKQQLEQTSLYQQALAQRKADESLVKQLQLAEHAVAQKQQLLSYLSAQQQQASQRYSAVLQHLQQIDQDDLWLNAFVLQPQHSSFKGVTLKPASVTSWLDKLSQLGYFRGQRFSQVSLTQVDASTAVGFELVATKGDGL